MQFFSVPKLKRAGIWLGVGSFLVGTALAVQVGLAEVACAEGTEPKKSAASDGTSDKFTELAVVDFDKLLKDRPDYERISQLDEQIRLLQQELDFLPLADRRRKVDSGRKRMEREVEKARNELQAESDRIGQELKNFRSTLAAQLERENKALNEHYQSVLRQRIEALTPKAQPQVPEDVRKRMDSFLSDLAGVRQQRISAKRLELERIMQNNLESARASMDERLAAYDSSLMEENQTQRVNLQLQLQTAANAEEESAIQDKLSALSDEETAKKSAKRDELSAEYKELEASERANVNSKMKAFEDSLDKETSAKAAAERNRLLKTVSVPSPQANKAEVEAQIEKIKAVINAEMEAKRASMTAAMQQKAEEAQRNMEKKQAELEKRLMATQKQLEAMVNSSQNDVSDETRKKMDDIKAKIEDLNKQRTELYDSMADDLRKVVGKIASEQEGEPSVIGSYVMNIDCLDLTDKTMIALEKEDQH
ncbi:MAG: hypothetical protein ACI38Q_02295 [Candidatus Bruticola sp.]